MAINGHFNIKIGYGDETSEGIESDLETQGSSYEKSKTSFSQK